MKIRQNKRERSIIDKYRAQGFEVLTKGWPDLCFFKNGEVFFIEVKRKQKRPSAKMGLSAHQRQMCKIFKILGLDLRVEYVA